MTERINDYLAEINGKRPREIKHFQNRQELLIGINSGQHNDVWWGAAGTWSQDGKKRKYHPGLIRRPPDRPSFESMQLKPEPVAAQASPLR